MKIALIKLHIAVFLAGFTGLLGVFIELNEGLLVTYRIAITVIALLLILLFTKQLQLLPAKNILQLIGIGFLIALHWVCFFGSIKYANVSIGLVCFASTGLFTAIFEPIIVKRKFVLSELLLGLLSLLSICLIFHFDIEYRTGIILGIISAILAALFSTFNKKYIHIASPKTMMLYELTGGLLILLLCLPVYLKYFPAKYMFPTFSDIGWLLILALLCTVVAMDLMFQALQKVSAFTQNLTLNLEPVYGIALAFIVRHENKYLSASFYVGTGLIALSVFIQMYITTKKYKRKSE
ncbi:MAG: DMT family transporter [Bacteroidetes bacterium]|nr:DMT family transporter [Bacteroidota bacterium]MBS1650346.1 DMT family transporter [Bacteroidota bacterium]